jgi:hypothetical protein
MAGEKPEQQEIDQAQGKSLADSAAMQPISIRLDRDLIDKLKELAALEGIGYQPLIRQVVTKYVHEHEYRLNRDLSIATLSDRAESLFLRAAELRQTILTLPDLAPERLRAESEYNTCLDRAQRLFNRVKGEAAGGPAVQHVALRLKQIAELTG